MGIVSQEGVGAPCSVAQFFTLFTAPRPPPRSNVSVSGGAEAFAAILRFAVHLKPWAVFGHDHGAGGAGAIVVAPKIASSTVIESSNSTVPSNGAAVVLETAKVKSQRRLWRQVKPTFVSESGAATDGVGLLPARSRTGRVRARYLAPGPDPEPAVSGPRSS